MSKYDELDFTLMDELTKDDACAGAVVAVAETWRKEGFGQGYKVGFEAGRVGGIMSLISAFICGGLLAVIGLEVAEMLKTPEFIEERE